MTEIFRNMCCVTFRLLLTISYKSSLWPTFEDHFKMSCSTDCSATVYQTWFFFCGSTYLPLQSSLASHISKVPCMYVFCYKYLMYSNRLSIHTVSDLKAAISCAIEMERLCIRTKWIGGLWLNIIYLKSAATLFANQKSLAPFSRLSDEVHASLHLKGLQNGGRSKLEVWKNDKFSGSLTYFKLSKYVGVS